MIGQTVSHYKILEKLGEGGMGVVYKAEDLKLTRTVALKFLPHGLDAHEPERTRFLQEARAAAILNHPNICTVYDIQEEDGQQFIVMEYVEGKTLREIVPLKKMQDAITYAIQIAEALQEAHTHGIVHRDIKAENIMVNSKNQVKVMDFGLAKLKGSLKLTKTSSTVGTLAYMAPEQLQGEEVDARSDIFSFGIVLYEMLTGHLPFRGEQEAAMMYSIVNEEPEPLQHYVPDAPSELLHILDRGLEKDREERYQTVHEMLIDLRRLKRQTSRVSRAPATPAAVIEGHEVVSQEQKAPTESERKRPQRAYLWIALAGVLALTVAAILFIIVPAGAPTANPNMTFRPVEIPYNQISHSSLSRDGNWIAFGAIDENKKWSVYFINASKGTPKKLVTEPYYAIGSVDISPDGSEILYCCGLTNKPGRIHVVSSSGGPSRKIVEPGWIGRWRPDGARIGYVCGEGSSQSGKREFRTVRPDGSDDRIEFVDSLKDVWGSNCFDWSPDAKSVAWLRSLPNSEEIIIRDLASGKEHQLTFYQKPIADIAWSPNNQILFSSGKGGNVNIWMVAAEGGEPVQITRGTGPDAGMRVSGDYQRLLYLETRYSSNVWSADIDGSNVRQLTSDDRFAVIPTFSPDRKHIAFSMNSGNPKDPGNKIFIMQSDGTNRMQLPTGEGNYVNARWSPDGRYITTSLWAPYDSGLVFLIESQSPSTPKLIGKGIGTWWIDSQKFVTIAPAPNVFTSLYTVDKPEPIKVSENFTCEFPLPDAEHILVAYSKKGQEGWWLKDTGTGQDTGPKQLLSGEYFGSAWPSVSLKYLLYLKSNQEVWRISLPDGHQQRLPEVLDGLNPFHMDFQLSADDKQVVYLKRRENSRLILIENPFNQRN